jgi:hypothetical protein
LSASSIPRTPQRRRIQACQLKKFTMPFAGQG